VRESLPREGRCYDLVWLLDAALAQRRLSLPHMRKLAELMADYVKVCYTELLVAIDAFRVMLLGRAAPHAQAC
jgi:hypothetical protein